MQNNMRGMMSSMNVGNTTTQTSVVVSKPKTTEQSIGNLKFAAPPSLRSGGPGSVGPVGPIDLALDT